jgi:hypothetical protein
MAGDKRRWGRGAPQGRPRGCGVMVLGYVVMHSSMLFFGGRPVPRLESGGHGARRSEDDRRRMGGAGGRALLELSVPATFPVIRVLRAVERAAPLIAEPSKGAPLTRAPHRRALGPTGHHRAGRREHRHRPGSLLGGEIDGDALERRPDPRERAPLTLRNQRPPFVPSGHLDRRRCGACFTHWSGIAVDLLPAGIVQRVSTSTECCARTRLRCQRCHR